MSEQFPGGTSITIISNVLILRGGQFDWAKDTAETILEALDIAGFKIVVAKEERGEQRTA